MPRTSIIAATVLLAGCPSKQPAAPHVPVDDTALRVRIAHAEARRGAGVAELEELAASSDAHTRELALRGLGRTGGTDAIATLQAALTDRDAIVVGAAATALGVAASLDDKLSIDTHVLVDLLGRGGPAHDAVAESLGRAGHPEDQVALVACVDKPACALALGRYGRRKIAFTQATRDALAHTHSYEAVYALAREHEPSGEAPALVDALASADAETRAVAIAGLAKRKLVASNRAPIATALHDKDWRVAVEAARALAAEDPEGRALVVKAFPGASPHVVHEALRAMIDKGLDGPTQTALSALVAEPGWTGCLAARVLGGPNVVDAVAKCSLPDHLKLPLLGDLSDPVAQRGALRILLASDDPRVRAAGIGMLAGTFVDADAHTRPTIVTLLTASLASKNSLVAGTAIDSISTVLDAKPDASLADALSSAIVSRANGETENDLATSLYGVIEKFKIVAGLDACKRGVEGPPPRARAAIACMTALGEAPPPATTATVSEPPVDVATVIGHHVTWHLVTAKGSIDIELRPDVAPWAVASVAALSQRHFYDGLELHRVVPNFVAQGGDPTESGAGGPGYALPAEPSGARDGLGFQTGGVGIADSGPDTGGSQWFIMHSRAAHLDGRYTWIGTVTSGQATVDALVIGDKVERATVEIR